ncbi:MAG: class 1 fructose-bisphosphatase [Candidatus Xenobia bacterium]
MSSPPASPQKLVTVQRHLMEEQSLHPQASGEFTRLMWDLILAFKIISREVNKAGLVEILGLTGEENVHGEQVKKLDAYSQDRIFKAMDHGGHLCVMGSEEVDDIIPIPSQFEKGKYVLLFDPLDGSSNIDYNISIGTIFSVYKRISPGSGDGNLADCTQRGLNQVAAGYCIYGSSTMLVYTAGRGVHGFTLDPSVGEFLLSHENIQIPDHGKVYSINEGNAFSWDKPTRAFIDYLKETDPATRRPYSLRYVGSLVADMHRTLLQGGVFLYPSDVRTPGKPKSKLRLMYEANPMALLVEHAGGKATTGQQRVLDVLPSGLHMKVPLIIGSRTEVDLYEKFVRELSAVPAS